MVGAILHVLYAEKDKTLAGVAAFLSDPKRPIESTLAAMMKTAHLDEGGPHPVIASAARELLNKSDNERSGVLSTAMSFLGLYRERLDKEWSLCYQYALALPAHFLLSAQVAHPRLRARWEELRREAD